MSDYMNMWKTLPSTFPFFLPYTYSTSHLQAKWRRKQDTTLHFPTWIPFNDLFAQKPVSQTHQPMVSEMLMLSSSVTVLQSRKLGLSHLPDIVSQTRGVKKPEVEYQEISSKVDTSSFILPEERLSMFD